MRNISKRNAFCLTVSLLAFFALFTLFRTAAPVVHGDEPAVFAGGAGTEEDPYLVATPRHLDNVRKHPGAHFRQTADIDLAGFSEGEGWDPIGHFRGWTDFSLFGGQYDGGGYNILNLTIKRPQSDYVGLFGYTDEAAVITGVGLENAAVSGRQYVGALVGRNSRNARIAGSYATGTVAGESSAGGLVGTNMGRIDDSHAAVDVTGTGMGVGGLAGKNEQACYITYSYAVGNVIGQGAVGGLVGTNAGVVKASFATGEVEGENMAGGLVGDNMPHPGFMAVGIENSYSTGNVSGKIRVGGLAGRHGRFNHIKRVYASSLNDRSNAIGAEGRR